ncbi:MAG: hypothetical protein AB7P24_09905 [Nitrospira sp.]
MFFRLVSVFLVTLAAHPWDSAGGAETTRVKDDLIGPVRSVTIKKHGYSTTETYDRAGHLIETVLDLTHVNMATYSHFRYDQDGHLQEELALDLNGRLLYRKQVVYARDPDGRDTASVTASDDGRFQNAEFSQYDHRGHLSEQLWVSASTTYKSLFDIQGHLIYSAYYRKGELLNELKHRYDVVGRLQELVSYDIRGKITGRVVNEYDESGKRTRSTTQIFGETRPRTWITTYEYDSLGNWIKEQTSEQSSSSLPAGAFTTPMVEERTIQYYGAADNDTIVRQ